MSGTESRLSGYRRRRDRFFGEHQHSPLTAEQKARFQGLDYFPERDDLVLALDLDTSGDQVGDGIGLSTTDGQTKPFFRAGTISFEVDGAPVTLTVLRDGERGSYFLPFRDGSAGNETYEVGRYLEPQALPDGRLHVDLNYAYNPYCAYGSGWSCPIPPEENRVAVAVPAGERAFRLPD